MTHRMLDLPLTELRSTMLRALAEGRDIEWSSGAARRWLVHTGYGDYSNERRYHLTPLGELAHKIDEEHRVSWGRKLLGGSPIQGGGNYYGTKVYCSCGWRDETNTAASRGGKKVLGAGWRLHVNAQANEALAALESAGETA